MRAVAVAVAVAVVVAVAVWVAVGVAVGVWVAVVVVVVMGRIRTGALPPWGGAVVQLTELEQAEQSAHRALERAVYATKPGESAVSALSLWLPPAEKPGATFFGVDRSKLELLRMPTLDEFIRAERRAIRRKAGSW